MTKIDKWEHLYIWLKQSGLSPDEIFELVCEETQTRRAAFVAAEENQLKLPLC